MSKSIFSRLTLVAGTVSAALMTSFSASAQALSDIFSNLTTEIKAAEPMIIAASVVAAMVCFWLAFQKIRDRNGQQTNTAAAVSYFVIGTCLSALGAFLSIGQETLGVAMNSGALSLIS